ncbi:MAG: DUF4339 domain-containing protein [Bacteriovorax sp.]|nr:DUF4339 domain-containing protein [Bacteriovorax sp.]
MVSWYYVLGSERVGPVGVETLKDLFLKEEINLESYVWRKGFQNWERIKDVSELDFSTPPEISKPKTERRTDLKVAKGPEENKKRNTEESSPEITFNFDWKSVREEEELFFIKIGHDRKAQLVSELFGPYSLIELQDAINDKRINNHSLIFAAGMPGWVEVGDTPLDPKNLKLNTSNVLDEAPLLIVIEHSPKPLVALVQKAGIKKCTLLGAGPFQAGKVVMCSMYSGSALKAKNLKLNIEEYNPREQKVLCSVIEINESAKKIMQNYAD